MSKITRVNVIRLTDSEIAIICENLTTRAGQVAGEEGERLLEIVEKLQEQASRGRGK